MSISPRDRRVINKQVSTQTIRGVYKKLYYHSLYYILYYTNIHIYTVYLSLYVLQNVTMYLVILFVLHYTTYIQYITVCTMYFILELIMYFIPIALVVALGGVLRIYIIFYKRYFENIVYSMNTCTLLYNMCRKCTLQANKLIAL